MSEGRPRFEADRREREELAERFFDAFREGDLAGLRDLLAADVHLVGDSGGKAPLAAQEAYGAEAVAAMMALVAERFGAIGVRLEAHVLNGQPGAIFHAPDGKVLSVMTLDVAEGRIQTIHAVVNPDKLAHVGPVADIWALSRAATKLVAGE
jgi:RNA polymerase sigma-70 factor (ECF subfamily)